MQDIPRPEVVAVLECLDTGKPIPEELQIWIPLSEVHGWMHYTTEPEDVLPSPYPLFGEPNAIHTEITQAGREALQAAREAAKREGGRP